MNGQTVTEIIKSDLFLDTTKAQLKKRAQDDDLQLFFMPMVNSVGRTTGYRVQVYYKEAFVFGSETIRTDPYGYGAKRTLRKTIRKSCKIVRKFKSL